MMTFKFNRVLYLLFLTLCLTSTFVLGATWYVDPISGDDINDGTNPFNVPHTNIGPVQTIDAAVLMANQYDVVVLADGVYSGQFNTSNYIMNMIDQLHLYILSFDGPENCTLELFENIAFDQSAVPMETCFLGISFSNNLLIQEPFMIRIGNGSNICFEDCIFTGFQSDRSDTSIFEITGDAQPVFRDCTFTSNQSNTILNCTGAMRLIVEQSSFTENQGVFSTTNLPFCIIKSNYYNTTGITIRDSMFYQNTSTGPMALISMVEGAYLRVDQSVIENNTTTSDEMQPCIGIKCSGVSEFTIQNTRIENQSVDSIIHNEPAVAISAGHNERTYISNCQVNNNDVGLYFQAEGPSTNSVEIVDCEFIGNTYPEANHGNDSLGGISFYMQGSAPDFLIRNCTLQKNSNGIFVHGYWVQNGFTKIQNCLVADNEFFGIAIPSPALTPHVITNCTIANNGESGIFASNTVIKNTIVRQEMGTPVQDNRDLTFNYCNIEGGWVGEGVGNIDVDPLFADPGYWDHDTQSIVPGTDYHLKSFAGWYDTSRGIWTEGMLPIPGYEGEISPCIDAGDPGDFIGDESYGSGGRINMGCYGGTWQASKSDICEGGLDGTGRMAGDINRDCQVNLADFSWFAADWLNSTLYETPTN